VDTVSTISINDLKQLKGFITQAIDKSCEDGLENGADLFNEDSVMTEADGDDGVEELQPPTQPVRPQLMPRSSERRSRSVAPEQSEFAASASKERSKSVPAEAIEEYASSPPFSSLFK
jgi:hypothetical protein